MGKQIKIRLMELGKSQTDLLHAVQKRGYPALYYTQLNTYINGAVVTPQSQAVMQIVCEILDEWENEAR